MGKKIYCDKRKAILTWFFFILSLIVLFVFIALVPYIKSYYYADLVNSGKTSFNIIYYAIIYLLVILAFFIGFAALFFAFLYSFCQRIVLTNKTIIFKEIFRTTEIRLKDITYFSIGKVNIPIIYSTGFGPMGSVSAWDYPSIYYKKEGKLICLTLPWFEIDGFVEELGKRAQWIKIKIPKKYLR